MLEQFSKIQIGLMLFYASNRFIYGILPAHFNALFKFIFMH